MSRSSSEEPVPVAPLKFPTKGFKLYDASDRIEEETLPTYDRKAFYPARLGEVITHGKNQYQLITKLGYGISSTVWLCYNLVNKQYKALKIHVNTLPFNRELEIFQHLNSLKQIEHPGKDYIRELDDSFQIRGPHGTHDVFVFEPLGFSLRRFQKRMPERIFDQQLVRMALCKVLLGLVYLHDVANVTHTDFHSDNLLLSITDDSIYSDITKSETVTDPVPRKPIENDGFIYSSRDIGAGAGEPVLCDFGLARKGKKHEGIAMPLQYRAPEVILGMQWGHPIDIWSFALTAWDLIQPVALFRIYSEKDMELNTAHHLADMVALLGPPPKEFLERSKACEKYWDKDGKWKHAVQIPTSRTIESLQRSLNGEDAVIFLSFIRKVLCWLPEQRPPTEHLLLDPWVNPWLELESK